MDNKKYIYRDSSNVEHSIEISKSDFNLSNIDKTIHDQKFKTKPTTFFKDALKRFSKNKSSVTGAIILGLLLLVSVIVPFANTNDISKPHPEETFIAPKLFPTGTGFWDGTRKYENIPCDPNNSFTKEGDDTIYYYPSTDSFVSSAIITSSITAPVVNNEINTPSSLVTGGHVLFTNDNDWSSGDGEAQKNTYYSKPSTYPLNSELLVSANFSDKKLEDYEQTPYQVVFRFKLEGETADDDYHRVVLRDYTTESTIDYSPLQTENIVPQIKEVIKEDLLAAEKEDISEEITQVVDASVAINLRATTVQNGISAILIKDVVLSTNESAPQSYKDILKEISFVDANQCLLRNITSTGYWAITSGLVSLYHGTGYTCSFTYDTYEAAYGTLTVMSSKTELQEYVDKGWLSDLPDLDAAAEASIYGTPEEVNEYFLAVKNDKTDEFCPISGISKVEKQSFGSLISYRITCTALKYKSLGYDSMPFYIWGTDAYGKDIFKRTFVGLRNSLALGLLVFAICFSFGLIWGSICGYFGGAVDIILERFTDILSGVPRIVVMTLCVLNLDGKIGDFWIFIIAMCLTGWIGTAALTRTQFYRFRDREYTLASRTLGAGHIRLIFRHILPNAMGTIITSSVLMIPSVIFTEATVSYLGLGFKSMESLGVILSNNQQYLEIYPHLILWPSAVMALIMISFNLFGNGLRDAFNPSLKGGE